MAGLIQVGDQYQQQSVSALKDVSKMERAREATKENLETAEKTQTMSAVGVGAGIGMVAGGPVGAAIGAGLGFVASQIF